MARQLRVPHPYTFKNRTMKKIVSIVILMAGFMALHGQPEKPVESVITEVTVFLNKAQVMRQAKTRLESGKTNLLVTGLTPQLDPQSIQVSGKGNFVILGISHRQNFLSEGVVTKNQQVLRDSLEWLQRQVAFEQSQKEILNKEEQLLITNQKIGGANQNLTMAELKAMADFFRTRLTDISASRMKIDERIKKLNDRMAKINAQLNEQSSSQRKNTSEIVVSVTADAATAAELNVSYVVQNAGWTALYDLRAISTSSPLQLSYKANVFQATGEEWKNVKLRLSTANPNQGGVKPQLFPWLLDFYNPPVVYRSQKEKSFSEAPMARTQPVVAEITNEAGSVADYVSAVQTMLNTEFEIALPYTVSSSNRPTLVDIRKHDVTATYQYACAPKLDTDAFLLANAVGWEELNLLPGEANLFFEGTFVGKTVIDPRASGDTLAISLGRDKRVVVKREKVKDLTSRSVIGSTKKESYTWEITVRNAKADAARVLIEDHVPVSQNTQIEVTVLDTGGARYNKQSGRLAWDLELKPNESRKLTYRFEVKYPKDKQVVGL
jgi:uncharacterized protein (TIGR02231 family)